MISFWFYEYRQFLLDTVLVKRTRLRSRNQETRQWSLISKRDLEAGSEIANVESIHHHDRAVFFRGFAAFACRQVARGEALTWHYGAAYQPIRDLHGYTAGSPCREVLDGSIFVKDNSRSVFDALRRVPSYCVWPVLSKGISLRGSGQRGAHRWTATERQSPTFRLEAARRRRIGTDPRKAGRTMQGNAHMESPQVRTRLEHR